MADDIYYDMHMDDGSDDYEKSKFSKIASLFFKSVVAIVVIGVFAILFGAIFAFIKSFITLSLKKNG